MPQNICLHSKQRGKGHWFFRSKRHPAGSNVKLLKKDRLKLRARDPKENGHYWASIQVFFLCISTWVCLRLSLKRCLHELSWTNVSGPSWWVLVSCCFISRTEEYHVKNFHAQISSIMYFRTQCYMQDVDSISLYCFRERSSAIIMKMSESLCHKLEAFPWWFQLPIRYQYWISNRNSHETSWNHVIICYNPLPQPLAPILASSWIAAMEGFTVEDETVPTVSPSVAPKTEAGFRRFNPDLFTKFCLSILFA